jgi:peptidoglycan-associated lipoprotein
MKRSFVLNALLLALAASMVSTGCKHKPPATEQIPNGRPTQVAPPDNNGQMIDNSGTGFQRNPGSTGRDLPPGNGSDGGAHALPQNPDFEHRPQDTNTFNLNTVYFDFDQFNIKSAEKSKIDQVADFFKNPQNAQDDLIVQGHCDERGTEQYNLSLGERRALSIRESLIGLGVSADKIHVISYGLSRPAALGHDEAAWSKNRRGVFVLVLPAPAR